VPRLGEWEPTEAAPNPGLPQAATRKHSASSGEDWSTYSRGSSTSSCRWPGGSRARWAETVGRAGERYREVGEVEHRHRTALDCPEASEAIPLRRLDALNTSPITADLSSFDQRGQD
jgi:hypothetical protein